MAIANTKYAGISAFTCTGTSLGDGAARGSLSVINTTTLFLDVIISGSIFTGAAVPTGNCYLLVGGADTAQVYSYPWAGTDAAVTLPRIAWAALESMQYGQQVPGTGLYFGCKIPTVGVALGTQVAIPNFSISQMFQMGGLTLPDYFGVVLCNFQGQAFDATAGHTVIDYNGITQNIA